jgi:hypothetical protein
MAVGVILAFWLPALFVNRPDMLRRRCVLAICCILGGTLVWDILSAQVIVKRDFFTGGVLLYPGAVVVSGTLLFLCAALTHAISKIEPGDATPKAFGVADRVSR